MSAMKASNARPLIQMLCAHPGVCVLLVLLLTLFLMYCVWTIRDGGSLTIRDNLLRLEVPAGAAEGRREPP